MELSAFPALVAGPDTLSKAIDFFCDRHVRKIFLLADPFMAASAMLVPFQEAAGAQGLEITLFSDFSGEPKLT